MHARCCLKISTGIILDSVTAPTELYPERVGVCMGRLQQDQQTIKIIRKSPSCSSAGSEPDCCTFYVSCRSLSLLNAWIECHDSFPFAWGVYIKLGAAVAMFIPLLRFILYCCLLLSPCVRAYKYEEFFYWYDRPGVPPPSLSYSSGVVCNESLNAYLQAASSSTGQFNGTGSVELCYVHEDCLLGEIRASWMANYQSAAVILGIMVRRVAASFLCLPYPRTDHLHPAHSSRFPRPSDFGDLVAIHPPTAPVLPAKRWSTGCVATANVRVRRPCGDSRHGY